MTRMIQLAPCYVTLEVATTSYFIKIILEEEWKLQVCERGNEERSGSKCYVFEYVCS